MKACIPVFAFVLLLVASCKKDVPLNTPVIKLLDDTTALPSYVPSWPMIKTVSYPYNGQTTTEHYYYDSLWRLIRLEYTGSSNNTLTYSYDSFGVYLNGNFYLSLNSQGLAQREYPLFTSYSFNADSNMTDHSGDHFGYTYSYTNRNMTSSNGWTENGGWGVGLSDNTYTYNTHVNTTGNYNRGRYFLGHSSINLVEHTDWHRRLSNGGGSGSNGFILFNYTYNNADWVSNMEERYAYVSSTWIDSTTTIYDTTITITPNTYTYY